MFFLNKNSFQFVNAFGINEIIVRLATIIASLSFSVVLVNTALTPKPKNIVCLSLTGFRELFDFRTEVN